MPPKEAVYQDPPDMPICLCLRYGMHTFSLLVSPLATFSDVTAELIFAIRDRDKNMDPTKKGLSARFGAPPKPLPPDSQGLHVSYGVLRDPNDSEKGWRDLKIQGDETPVSKGLKNSSLVAFVIRDPDDLDSPPEFVVQWPQLSPDDEEAGEDEEEGEDAREWMAARKGKLRAMDEDDDVDI